MVIIFNRFVLIGLNFIGESLDLLVSVTQRPYRDGLALLFFKKLRKMKILKLNTKEVFDTENVNLIEIYQGKKPDISKALHQNHELTDYEFLQQFFPLNHSIFTGFSSSFYYILH